MTLGGMCFYNSTSHDQLIPLVLAATIICSKNWHELGASLYLNIPPETIDERLPWKS